MRPNHLFTIAGALAMGAAAPALAQKAPDVPASVQSREMGADRVICKSAAPAGTRFRTRTCYTAQEWDQLAETTKRHMGEQVIRKESTSKRKVAGAK